jgi:hypothetical protein
MDASTIVKHTCKTFFGTPKPGFGCPIIQGRKDGLYELVEPYKVEVNDIGFVVVISLKPGFVFDGASVPRLLWFAAGEPMLPPRVAAALVHDWLYRAQVLDRGVADEIFNILCKAVGMSAWRTGPEWAALRIFGRVAWKQNHSWDKIAVARRFGVMDVKEAA